MNDEEIMQKFNETFADKPEEKTEKKDDVTPYRATVNQNIAPSKVTIPTSNNNEIPPLNSNQKKPDNQPQPETENNKEVQQNIMNTDENNYRQNEKQPENINYNYVPTHESKNKKTISIKISPELKPIIIIVIILFVVIMIIPNVYDFFTHVR